LLWTRGDATKGGDEQTNVGEEATAESVVCEELDAGLEDKSLAVEDAGVVTRADAGRADKDFADALDFPLRVEWWKYKFSTSFSD
jgi:hypothetical protein